MRFKILILVLTIFTATACIHSTPRLPAQATESSFQSYLEAQKSRGSQDGTVTFAKILLNARVLAHTSAQYRKEYNLTDSEFVAIFEYTSIF